MPRKPPRRGRTRAIAALAAIALLFVAAFAGHRWLRAKGHPGLPRLVKQVLVNYPKGFTSHPPLLELRVEETDLERLRTVVEAARERGVIMPEGNEYVPAELEHDGRTFRARVRIKGKMTDHVKGAKWSFRVKARKDGGFLGMKTFSLQHPGTRNYLCDWLYHRIAAGEGLIALRYGFIRLRLNGEDLGIYAYEEHFGPELLEHNGRLDGPLFRFDPALFWEYRLNMMRKFRFDEPYAAYQAAAIDAFGSAELAKDPKARASFEEAVALVEGFRRGDLRASEVFDTDRIARHHAILDLVGGHHSMDWSDVKFHYDPLARRVEPVAYESFSAHPIRSLAGSHRYTGAHHPAMSLHDAWFNDEAIFRAYVHHLERLSRPSYLDSLFGALGPALDTASATLYREFPYKELDRGVYRHNQRVIRAQLNAPATFHAYRRSLHGDTLIVDVVPVHGLPAEVHALVLADGTAVPPLGRAIVPARLRGRPGMPVELRFRVPDARSAGPDAELRLEHSVLGAGVRRQCGVFAHALLQGINPAAWNTTSAPDMRTVPFIAVDDAERSVIIKPGNWVLDVPLSIPADWSVRATAPLRLELRGGGGITSRSPLHIDGLPDAPVVITVNGDGGLLLLETAGESRWRHVRIEARAAGDRPVVVFQQAAATLEACELGAEHGRDIVLAVRSRLSLVDCTITGGRDQVIAAFSTTHVQDGRLWGADDDALSARGGRLAMAGVQVDGSAGSGVKLSASAEAEVQGGRVRASERALEVEEGSRIVLNGVELISPGTGVEVRDALMRYGPSRVELNGVRFDAGGVEVSAGTGNTIIRDGVRSPAPTAANRP